MVGCESVSFKWPLWAVIALVAGALLSLTGLIGYWRMDEALNDAHLVEMPKWAVWMLEIGVVLFVTGFFRLVWTIWMILDWFAVRSSMRHWGTIQGCVLLVVALAVAFSAMMWNPFR